jgi:hypothetical protein
MRVWGRRVVVWEDWTNDNGEDLVMGDDFNVDDEEGWGASAGAAGLTQAGLATGVCI